jgi:2-amino-4-hydroxy-6-hydroxymethyldihydropteridine diphosphokinase
MFGVDLIELPAWAQVNEKRRAHIARVTALLDRWASELRVPPDEARAWHDAGIYHDALRDAPEAELRALVRDPSLPPQILHGPAAAERLRRDGENREDVLDAVRWHTVGNGAWARTGRALYMADFLEPGRSFARADRAFLASHLVHDFEGVFRQVVRQRLEWSLREGNRLYPETVSLWNDVA